jgi:beta-lactamase superfamily II metal-dependent hydrolase
MSVVPEPNTALVRMYNVGFGDAFLLVLPGADRPQRVLIDCGSHFLGAGPRPMKKVVENIIEDVTDDDGVPRIDVVVATHRHQDHVSGFANAAWADVEVGEVWMPWTEDPDDKKAREILREQSSVANKLTLGLQALGFGDDFLPLSLAKNALSNHKAMRMVHDGFAGDPKRRFLSGEGRPRTLKTPALPGVAVYVLGPSRDPDVIRDMNPPAGGSFLAMADPSGTGEDLKAPFREEWEVAPADYDREYVKLGEALEQADRDKIAEQAGFDAFSVAVALEAAVNGTSLVLAFEIRDALLLFPGDAQWGTWKAMLDRPETVDLLERTTFHKVSHHGSHNGTPRSFVERLKEARKDDGDAPDAWAMVSTRRMDAWKDIPRAPLLKALGGTANHLARSDRGDDQRQEGFSEWGENLIEATVPLT